MSWTDQALSAALGFPVLRERWAQDAKWSAWLERAERDALTRLRAHGDFEAWLEAISEIPELSREDSVFALDCPLLGARSALTQDSQSRSARALERLGPWKKGPFSVHGTVIDAEWRCHLKWERVLEMNTTFLGKRVIDVGSGNGYFLQRLLGAGAALAWGIEPSVLYTAQFLALSRGLDHPELAFLPLPFERLPEASPQFDAALSMGVLYHRRSPLDHLYQLRACLVSGGELILETLVVEGPEGHTLLPRDRYAQMRNVWFIPSPKTLESWLRRVGFKNLRFSENTPTTEEEQRRTAWMDQPSLRDFLDPLDPRKTIEGYPAPTRVVVVAQAP